MERTAQYNTKELLALLKQDSSIAFTEIYNRYWQKLFAIAYNRLKEIEAAEDIVHDVFASLWATRHKVQIDALESYLATAAKYMILGRLRKLERQRKYNNSLHSSPVVDFPIESSVHYKRILEIVKRQVDNLPDKCRLIFNFSRNEGMPVKQIARELNLSPKTVENQLTKAIRFIKKAANLFVVSAIIAFLTFFL